MDVIWFLIIWFGGAVLHTLYERKMKGGVDGHISKTGRRGNGGSTVRGNR